MRPKVICAKNHEANGSEYMGVSTMKLTQLFFASVSFLLLLVLSEGTFNAKAQDLPPIVPAINRELDRAGQITVSNAEQAAPVAAVAVLRLSQRAYGAGFLTLKNVSDKSILTLRGVWEISTSEGGTLRHGWNFGGATAQLTGGIKPGQEVKLPVAGPPNYAIDSPHKITKLSVLITGVVFKDRTYWGEDGYQIYMNYTRDVKNMLLVAEKVRERFEKLPPQVLVDQLTDPQSIRSGRSSELFPDMMYRLVFPSLLLDEHNSLRPDAMQRLDKMIISLSGWIR